MRILVPVCATSYAHERPANQGRKMLSRESSESYEVTAASDGQLLGAAPDDGMISRRSSGSS